MTTSSTSTSTSLASWTTHNHQQNRISNHLLSSNRSPSSIEFDNLSKSPLPLSLRIFQHPSISSPTDILFYRRILHYVNVRRCLSERDHEFLLEAVMTILKWLIGLCPPCFKGKDTMCLLSLSSLFYLAMRKVLKVKLQKVLPCWSISPSLEDALKRFTSPSRRQQSSKLSMFHPSWVC